VDSKNGKDDHDGSLAKPWQTVNHALRHLKPGDTLYLRGGTYYENIYLALAGRKEAPITIRAYPGEQAVIDGGLREFFESPATAWEPFPTGAPGEYRSKRSYPNLRHVQGSFGDSMVGLQTYYHAKDLRSTSESIDWEDWNRQAETDLKPLYCGPGLWYDPETGHVHLRLTHTHLPDSVPNYRGETDPRQLPLVLASSRSIPLHVDGGKHLRVQDLVIRGGGYTTIQLDHAQDIEFDQVTVWCSTYGIRAACTGPLRIHRCSLYGNVAPWTFRGDGSKRDYPGRPHRNLSRLNTHALLEIDSGRESSVYATPQNDQWEISYCEFTEAHDALYLGAINVRFHHNLIDNMQDDGIYLSPMYHRHRLDKNDPQIHIDRNVFRRVLTALAFGGTETETRDQVHIYRNLIDLRGPIQTGRPSVKRPEPIFSTGKIMGDHGSPPWSAMNIYHNTFVMVEGAREPDMATLGGSKAGNPRRVFNNIFLHLQRLPGAVNPNPAGNVIEDGNLYWAPGTEEKAAQALFQRFRASDLFTQSKQLHPAGSTTHSRAADPRFMKMGTKATDENDYRLQPGSPAIDAGVDLPADWLDPLRTADRGKPDIGALPQGAEPLRVGRAAAN
jgi:hypothetical protein